MSEDVMYVNARPHASLETLFERLFTGRYETVNITTNKRVLRLDDLTSYAQFPSTFYIFEKATIEGFKKGGYVDVDHLEYDGGNIIVNTGKMISCEPITGNMFENIAGDGGEYIGHVYQNVLITAMELDKVDRTFLEWLFNEKFGLTPMSEAEYFSNKFTKISNKINERTINEVIKKQSNALMTMDSMFSSYKSNRDAYMQYTAQLQGLQSFNEGYNTHVTDQIRRLLESEFLDSLNLEGDVIIITTKPLYMGIWNIGQFTVTYKMQYNEPRFERLTEPLTLDRSSLTSGSGLEIRDHAHPHIKTDGKACNGNWGDMFRSFWDLDMLTGFNRAIEYLRSTYDDGAPSIRFNNWLASIGYIHDSVIVEQNDIRKVENGIAYRGSKNSGWTEVPNEELIAMGCTGEIETDPKKYIEFYNKRQEKENRIKAKEIIYHAWGDPDE